MSADNASRFQWLLTWIVVVLTAVLLLLGIVMHGFSAEVHQRFWADIFGRLHGPMTFRFFLQPTMALLAALPDGIADARQGHSSFFWTNRGDPTVQRGRLRQGLVSTARVLLIDISMDVIYQLKEFDRFYPAEAVIMALLLALIPYFIFRWIIERVAGWWFGRKSAERTGGWDMEEVTASRNSEPDRYSLDAAKKYGFHVVSIKNDWKTVVAP